MNILIAEDDPTALFILQKMLEKEGFTITSATNGLEAFNHIQHQKFDAVLTDWMMPKMDGIELIRKIRDFVKPPPLIVVITSISSASARSHALESGADEFMTKPVYPKAVIELLKTCEQKKNQSPPATPPSVFTFNRPQNPSRFFGVFIGASSGGPNAIRRVFQKIEKTTQASFFVVLHGPAWVLETFAELLQTDTPLHVEMGRDHIVPQPGCVYLAPGDKHMALEQKEDLFIQLNNGPVENFARPSVDPLFRSGAAVFGKSAIGVILTGMGCDGSMGAAHISRTGGTVIAQDPLTAMVSSMPQKTIDLGVAKDILNVDKIGEVVSYYIKTLPH